MFPPDRDADPRVLKIQLDIIAGLGRSAWISTPLWALALAALGSGALGWFGRQPVVVAAIFPLIVTVVSWSVARCRRDISVARHVCTEHGQRLTKPTRNNRAHIGSTCARAFSDGPVAGL